MYTVKENSSVQPLLWPCIHQALNITAFHVLFFIKLQMHDSGGLYYNVATGSSVQSLSLCHPWTAARQASLSITSSWSLLKPMSIESVMPSNHLILCHPLLLLVSTFPIIRVFSNKSALRIRWPKY